MLKKLSIWVFFIILTGIVAAQDAGKIKGDVKDETGTPIEFATVVILNDGIIRGSAITNEKGEYVISPIAPGVYDVKAAFAGYMVVVNGVDVAPNKVVVLSLKLDEVKYIDE